MKSIIFLCLIGITANANAYSVELQVDGSVRIKGCHEQTIGKTNYICCDNNCQTKDYWIRRAYSNVEVNYMSDMPERATIDRYTMTDVKVEMTRDDDKTPALGKVQKKLDDLGDKVFGVFGL